MKLLMLLGDSTYSKGSSNGQNFVSSLIVRALLIIGLLMFFSSESMAGKDVRYNGNNATSGTAPATADYNNGNTVVVLGNSGNLVKTGYVFSGWNTNSSGTGTTYQPGATFTMGTDDITLYAKWVVVAQTPPIMADVPNQITTVGTTFNLNISSYVTQTDGDAITSYTLTGTLPAGLSFNTTTGVISGTPTTAGAAVTLSVTAADNDGSSNSDSFTLTVNAAQIPPIMGDVPNQIITVGTAFNINIPSYVTQTDGDAVASYALTGTLPAGLSFNTTTGVISGTPTTAGAAVTFSITATDNDGTSNSDSFTITVNSAGTVTPPPGQCGIFPSVLTTYDHITSSGNNDQACYTGSISYPEGEITGTITCNPDGCGGTTACIRFDPPVVQYTVSFPTIPTTATTIPTDTSLSPDQMSSTSSVNDYKILGNVTVTGNSTLSFAPGDYYFNSLTFADNNPSIVLSSGGPVRIFIKNNFTVTQNGLNLNANGIPDNLFIYVGGNMDFFTNGNVEELVAFFYVKGSVLLDANSNNFKVTGGITSEGPITIGGNNGDFIQNGDSSDLGYGNCTSSYTYQTGVFDAVDLCNVHSVGCLNTKIKTKIVNKPFNLTALSLNTTATALQTRTPTVNVDVSLTKNNGTTYDIVKSLSSVDFTSSISALDISSITHDKAAKDMRVIFRFCKDSSGGIYAWNGGFCGIGKSTDYAMSSDNFAIRPEKLDINSTDTVTLDALPNLMKAGEAYSILISGHGYNSVIPAPDYTIASANSVYTKIITKYDRNNNISGTMTGTETVGGFDMSDGVSTPIEFSFDNVGKINFKVEDRVWSAVDNSDGTLLDCSVNGAYVCGDKNVTFIPDHFDFNELNITNNNGSPGTFTYIANEVDQMGGRIHAQIRALNKAGNVTTNFATSPLWENNISVTPVVRSNLYLHPDANETTISNLALGFTAGVKTIPWNETNTSQYLRFNFQRDINLPQKPFDVNGSDLDILAASIYTDPDDGDSAIINGSRDGTADGKSTFVYGRIIPRDVRVFGPVSYTANGWYEVYNSPLIGTTALPVSRNDSSWNTNTLHSDLSDGDANVTVPTGVGNGTAVSGVESYNFDASTTVPFSTKAHIRTAPWLWYGANASPYSDPGTDCLTHPCFNINVVPAVGATGSAKTDAESTKSDKSSAKGGTPWKSTSDYAPAVR